jgi:tetratricopeptide (TPR) repeat protein
MRYLRSAILAGAVALLTVTPTMVRPAWGLTAVPVIYTGPSTIEQGSVEVSIKPAIPRSPYHAFEGTLNPLEVRLFDDAAEGRLDNHSLLAATLIASGVDQPQVLRRLDAQLSAWTDELARSGRLAGPPQEQAQAIFEFMHRRILTAGYGRDWTDLRAALEQGRFNCVSATVVFNCLAQRLGLKTCGLEIPGHAMSRLLLPQGSLDIETTCPTWFELTHDPQQQAEMVRRTLGVPPSGPASRKRCREVTDVQLAAMIYYNRGVDWLAEQRFADALSANAKALRLDAASTTARGNLLAALNNWAITLAAAGQFAAAAERLEQGLALDPLYEAFVSNYAHVYYQWVESLSKTGRYAEAIEILEQGRRELPANSYFHAAPVDVDRRWVKAELAAGRVDDALAVLAQAEQRLGPSAEWTDAAVAELNAHALALLDAQQFEEAVAFLDRVLARYPEASPLRENRRVAVMRWAEPAFRQGDYAEAIRRTTYHALPGQLHPSLLNNVRYGYCHWIEDLRATGRSDVAEHILQQAKTDPFLAEEGGRGPVAESLAQGAGIRHSQPTTSNLVIRSQSPIPNP